MLFELPLDSVPRIEAAMASVIVDWQLYTEYRNECARLIEVMGNVDSDEIYAICAVAFVMLTTRR